MISKLKISKLKTLPAFLLNLFWIKYFILPIILFLPGAPLAEENKIPPLERLKTISQNYYKNTSFKSITKVDPEATYISLDPFFATDLLTSSEFKKWSFELPQCSLYALIELGLIQTPLPSKLNILANIKLPIGNKPYFLTREEFFNTFYQFECFKNPQYKAEMNPSNWGETLKSFNFKVPSKKASCQQFLKDWMQNPRTPYLCASLQNPQLTALMGNYEKKFSQLFCQAPSATETICSTYNQSNYWKKILTEEVDILPIVPICQAQIKKRNLLPADVNRCIELININPHICTLPTAYSSRFSGPPCPQLEKNFLHQIPEFSYLDCPQKVNHHSISTAARLIHYFQQPRFVSEDHCAGESYHTVLQFLKKTEQDLNFKQRLCYFSLFTKKDECTPVFFAYHPDNPAAINLAAGYALHRMMGIDNKTQCKFVDNAQFNPILLEYKVGCFVVYQNKLCSASQCKFEIYYNGKMVPNITYRGDVELEFFPSSPHSANFSIFEQVKRSFNLKMRFIDNYTVLNTFFRDHSKSPVVGEGCIEVLLPQYFSSQSYMACTKITFLILGTYNDNNEMGVIMVTGEDAVQTPRFVPWKFLYASLLRAKQLHPMQSWTMYGLY